MEGKRVKVTKGNTEAIRKSLNSDFVSLTLTLERELIKKHAPRTAK